MWDAFSVSAGSQDWAGGNPVFVFNHVPGGSNVLYMDGHVEYLRYGSQYPILGVTSATAVPESYAAAGGYSQPAYYTQLAVRAGMG